VSHAGALRFARYAYPPNELGYCGPPGAQAMLDGVEDDIKGRARRFEGAWVYLQTLADALGTDDPLADEVVEAYWIGSDLLDRVTPVALLARLEDRFRHQAGGTWRESAARARAHHSYQVFEVYPWAAMLRAGLPAGPAVTVLDRCRIRCGVVREVDDEWVTVTSQLLVWDAGRLRPQGQGLERARWSVDGRSLLARPGPGDVVALHWDWVCDVLSEDQATRIRRLEQEQRVAVGL